MKINCNTPFGPLKEVIVGRELTISNRRVCDFTFKNLYKENLHESVYDKVGDYYVDYDLLQLRNEQLNALASTLQKLGVNVHRPDELTSIKYFATPDFKSELSSASNVRDVSLVYRDTILETPTYVQNRYFENLSMYSIFSSFESKWIRAPHTKITESTFDLEDWKVKRDFSNFDKTKYVMAIDGAQFLRIGSDVIVNISSYNHYLALEWLKPLFPDTTFHIVELTDNHIDGTLMALKPGVFLVNTGTDFDTLNLDSLRQRLPLKFRDWELIHPKNLNKPSPDFEMQLASSRGMDINVLSLDEKRVLVNKDAKGVAEALDRANFEVISVSLDNCEVFGGGIHCSTLDLVREDEFKEYV